MKFCAGVGWVGGSEVTLSLRLRTQLLIGPVTDANSKEPQSCQQ